MISFYVEQQEDEYWGSQKHFGHVHVVLFTRLYRNIIHYSMCDMEITAPSLKWIFTTKWHLGLSFLSTVETFQHWCSDYSSMALGTTNCHVPSPIHSFATKRLCNIFVILFTYFGLVTAFECLISVRKADGLVVVLFRNKLFVNITISMIRYGNLTV